MHHGILFRRQGIDEGLARDEVLGPQLGQEAAGVGDGRRYVGDRAKDVGPVKGRCCNQYLQKERVVFGQGQELAERILVRLVTGNKILADTVRNYTGFDKY